MSDFSSFIEQLKIEKKILRMTFLGDGAVGKTSLVRSILKQYGHDDEELPKLERTPFININAWKQKDFKVQCFDLAGQRVENAHPVDLLTKQVFQSLDIIFFVFSLDRFASFEHLDSWFTLVEESLKKIGDKGKTNMVLIGNKSDLPPQVDQSLVDNVVDGGMFRSYVKTSAVNMDGLEELNNIIEEIKEENFAKE